MEIVIFYTEILTGKVVLWCFFSSETSENVKYGGLEKRKEK